VFQTAGRNPRPFEVKKINTSHILRWDLVSVKYFVGNLIGKISRIRVATFKKGRNKVAIKYSMAPDAPISHIDMATKIKRLELPNCYPTPLPISKKKHDDLMKLCTDQVIPAHFHTEYS
jgi:hypothetical protein